MSDQLPRKRIDPLPPPPGQLDRVLGQARYRRHRRAMAILSVALVFVTGLGGGFALGRDVPRDLIDAAGSFVDGQQPNDAVSATPSSGHKAAATKKKETRKPSHRATEAASGTNHPARGALAYRGQAVGAAGQPAVGLYVYVGISGIEGFRPDGWAVDRTDEQGKFTLSCPNAPVLLAPWPLRGDAKSKARNVAWAATFVGGATDPAVAEDAPCTRQNKVDVTRIGRGSAVEGKVALPAGCQAETRSLQVWLHNDPDTYVKAQDLSDGETFRVSGLPPGEHTLNAKGRLTRFLVGGGTTAHENITFPCVDLPTVTPTPSVTTSTPTATPDPTSSTTTSPSSTASGTAEPSTSTSP